MDRKSTREQIVAAAHELMWKQGYQRTSVDEIVKKADVCKGSFYHHFDSKESLGLAVIDSWSASFAGQIRRALGPGASPEDGLRAILSAAMASQRDHADAGCPLGRLALEMTGASERLEGRLRESFEDWSEVFAARLRDGGMAEAEARDYGQYMLATLQGALMLNRVNSGGHVLDRLAGMMMAEVSHRLAATTVQG